MMTANQWKNINCAPKNIRDNLSSRALPYLFLIFLLFLFSCASSHYAVKSDTDYVIKDVPFFPQENYQCGPSSLAGVLNYWGIESSPETIAREIYSGSAKGTLSVDMVLYARKKGLNSVQSRGSIQYLKENIDLGYPVIVLVDNGFWVYQQNHFMVIVGYNKNGVLVNSGGKGFKFIPQEDFLKSWERADYWTLLIGHQKSSPQKKENLQG